MLARATYKRGKVKGMSNRQLVQFLIFLGGLFSVFTLWQMQRKSDLIKKLPDHPGKETLVKRCTSCHDVSPILAKKLTREQWDKTILWMQKMQGMPPLDGDEKQVILDYLSRLPGKDANSL